MSEHDASGRRELIHEMRNQLAVAQANLEAFIDGKLPPTPERLQSIVQALRQVDALIDDLPDERGSAGVQTRLTEINVCSLLEREFVSMQAPAARKNVSLSVFRCPHPAAQCQRFYGDPVRIGQIVKNLLINAIRYTPVGGSISVDCGRRADQLEVTIRDSGPGVVPEDRERIFELGYRGGAGKSVEGSGIGLSVVKELVEAQGGSVVLKETSSRGATFMLRLPGRLPEAGSI